MLAFMPHSAPHSAHESMSTSTMSLAILPSQPMAYSESSAPTLHRPSPSPAKRPKLSLDTNNVPSIFGKSSTSLRLETLSATSPTARNTFRNALNPPQAPQLPPRSRPTLAPLATELITEEPSSMVPAECTDDDGAESSSSSISSASTVESLHGGIPYKLPYTTSSILINSPIISRKRRAPYGPFKPMFPAPKKVAFRSPLTEDVHTTKYTLRHSDIDSSCSTISTLELTPAEDNESSTSDSSSDRSHASSPPRSRSSSPRTGDKRESSDEEDSTDESCPTTPVAGRRKRQRHWVWTLGPIDSPESSISEASSKPSSAESSLHLDEGQTNLDR